jgi:C4-dicarboxylate-specific signal transduction histidine kinase
MGDTDLIFSSIRILVVDDEPIDRQIMVTLLSREGYRVIEAGDGMEALRVVKANGADLVLLDVVMPGMDGFETCRRIRREMGNLTLPVIFVTSLEDRASRVRGKDLGADDFLCKPVDAVELRARVRNLLRLKAYHDLRAHQKEKLEADLERMRGQLLHADRLATLGTLAGGVGHELNNVLNVLVATVDFVRERAKLGAPARDKDLERLDAVAQHVATHARQLLNFARPGPDFAERSDLRDVIRETLGMLRVAGRLKGLEVQMNMPAGPVAVTVNRMRLEQVIVNLVGNAADAVAEAKQPRRWIRISLTEPAGGRVACSVEDNGGGIPADKLLTVFEPYYTTKPPGKGTGLGLPVVKNIVEGYGGRVAVTSRFGEGSCFSFDLPAGT